MSTLRLKVRRDSGGTQQRDPPYFSPLRAYVDHWRPPALRCAENGEPLRVREPPPVPRVMLTLQTHKKLQRLNILKPALQPTHRMLLRWGEGGGNGLPNPEAEIRELHYDPLPPDLQEAVDEIVGGSPWETLTRKWYRTNLTNKDLADLLCISRKQLYIDWNASLWYYRGRFEENGLHE